MAAGSSPLQPSRLHPFAVEAAFAIAGAAVYAPDPDTARREWVRGQRDDEPGVWPKHAERSPSRTGRRSRRKPTAPCGSGRTSCPRSATSTSTAGRCATWGCGFSSRQGSLFADGSDRHYYAVATNIGSRSVSIRIRHVRRQRLHGGGVLTCRLRRCKILCLEPRSASRAIRSPRSPLAAGFRPSGAPVSAPAVWWWKRAEIPRLL